MYKLTLEQGKYTIQHDNGANFKALRNGEEWRDLTGDSLMLALVRHVQDLEEAIGDYVVKVCKEKAASSVSKKVGVSGQLWHDTQDCDDILGSLNSCTQADLETIIYNLFTDIACLKEDLIKAGGNI